MENNQNINVDSQDPEELKDQVLNLSQEIEYLRTTNQAMWFSLISISKKMQVSSAAIKASVSSLLDYDIIWDGSTQYELLEIIDSSSDQVSKHATLLTLVFKINSNEFTLNPEPTEIYEILSSVTRIVDGNYPEFTINFNTQTPGNPVFVDYEYLSIALVMLFELIIETQTLPQQLDLLAVESKDDWFVDIEEIGKDIIDMLLKVSGREANELLQDVYLLPTNKLKLYVVRKIFDLQSIRITTQPRIEAPMSIRLLIPTVK
ncbi:MAG: hypothetical protein ISS57_10410 [Anaerolineales bacterium]|nr:hypothetical protein [Anaerolineales bacterium]